MPSSRVTTRIEEEEEKEEEEEGGSTRPENMKAIDA
jgi:hypothetical protein